MEKKEKKKKKKGKGKAKGKGKKKEKKELNMRSPAEYRMDDTFVPDSTLPSNAFDNSPDIPKVLTSSLLQVSKSTMIVQKPKKKPLKPFGRIMHAGDNSSKIQRRRRRR